APAADWPALARRRRSPTRQQPPTPLAAQPLRRPPRPSRSPYRRRRTTRALPRRNPYIADPIALDAKDKGMRTITISLDEETDRRVEEAASRRGTSVSALVKRFLQDLAAGESEFERLKREERDLRKRITNFSASENVPRDELYDRNTFR